MHTPPNSGNCSYRIAAPRSGVNSWEATAATSGAPSVAPVLSSRPGDAAPGTGDSSRDLAAADASSAGGGGASLLCAVTGVVGVVAGLGLSKIL